MRKSAALFYLPVLILFAITAFGTNRLVTQPLRAETKDPVIRFVKIGDQDWMTENLDVTAFRNGDEILQAHSREDWERAAEQQLPAWAYYNFDSTQNPVYGKLYNWFAVNDARGLAPEGWHVASKDEWFKLIENAGGWTNGGSKLKGVTGWKNDGNGINELGFDAQPAGYLSMENDFANREMAGAWWTSTAAPEESQDEGGAMAPPSSANEKAMVVLLTNNYAGIQLIQYQTYCGLSVRCVRDKP